MIMTIEEIYKLAKAKKLTLASLYRQANLTYVTCWRHRTKRVEPDTKTLKKLQKIVEEA